MLSSGHHQTTVQITVRCTLCFVVVCVLALAVAELVMGIRHRDDTTCSNDQLMNPSTWLIVQGAYSIGSFFLLVCLSFAGVVTLMSTDRVSTSLVGCGFFLILFTYYLGVLLSVAWSIIGAVMLWRDNLSCEPESFNDMLWASVIIHLIVSVCTLCWRPSSGGAASRS